MIDLLYQAYVIAWLPVCVLTALAGWRMRDQGIIRCALVTFLGQVALDMWFQVGPGMINGKQPLIVFLLVYAVSCVLLTVRPTTKLCSMFGGIFLGAVLICGVHGGEYLFGEAPHDRTFWINNLFIGWALLLGLIGGAGFDMGKSLVLLIHRRFDGVFRNARQGGMG